MDSGQVILWMIIICVAFSGYLLFAQQIKFVGRLLIRSAVCCAGFWAVNSVFLLAGITASVGINPVTALIAGMLGAPGFVCLYIAQFIL